MKRILKLGVLLCPVLFMPPADIRAQEEAQGNFELDASVRYYYGDWTLGELDMDPVYGMIGPTVTARFWDRRLVLTAQYVTGDFEGDARLDIPTAPEFGSRKDYNYQARSQELDFLVGLTLVRGLTLLGGYKYVEYDLNSQIKFNSDIREYGSGEEILHVNAKSPQLGAELQLQLHERWRFSGRGLYMPDLATESEGSFRYEFLDPDKNLEEEWQDNNSADGFSILAGLTYALPNQPVNLTVGYALQELEADQVASTWFDDFTQTVNPGNSFPKDTFEGAFFDILFRF